MRKIIEYWCTSKLDREIEEVLFVLQLCDLFGIIRTELIVEEYLKLFENSNEYDLNLIPEAFRKPYIIKAKNDSEIEKREEIRSVSWQSIKRSLYNLIVRLKL